MQNENLKNWVSKDKLRKDFSAAMSAMYQNEVPLYGTLIELVKHANSGMLEKHPELKETLQQANNLNRISEERHGAIRLGKASELFHIRRLFAVIGMEAVGYYDLSVVGIPVHSTAFRPIDNHALSINPFRVFTSLLRMDLIEDSELLKEANDILINRNIFSDSLLSLIDLAEQQGGLKDDQAKNFIMEAVDVFRWHDEAQVDQQTYQRLKEAHPLIADVVSFKGPHINHLTPATLDIDEVQFSMSAQNIDAKAVVEGPPTRQCPILLRQTSFKALQEAVKFPNAIESENTNVNVSDDSVIGFHTARFGEVEQRGVALTKTGQQLYDQLLSQTRARIIPAGDGSNADEYVRELEQVFINFPDTHQALREAQLAYYFYSLTMDADQINGQGKSLEELIELGYVRFDPIIYEDFLPVSAAGIFQSNLSVGLGNKTDSKGRVVSCDVKTETHQIDFEQALGVDVVDMYKLYEKQQQQSIDECLQFFNTLHS